MKRSGVSVWLKLTKDNPEEAGRATTNGYAIVERFPSCAVNTPCSSALVPDGRPIGAVWSAETRHIARQLLSRRRGEVVDDGDVFASSRECGERDDEDEVDQRQHCHEDHKRDGRPLEADVEEALVRTLHRVQ